MAETQSTVPTTTEATAPTGDIKIFIDAFNKDFDVEIKQLVDAQQNYKNVYADAIKITTPKEGPWPNDPKVVTIGDLFKYTFPDINSDKMVKPPIPSSGKGDGPGVERWDNYFGFQKDLDDSKDEKIKKMYYTILKGINSNSKLLHFQELKKPGITNPSLWSPGQYYFDVFMSFMLSESGPLKDPDDRNGGQNGIGTKYDKDSFYSKNGGSVSVANFDPTGEAEYLKVTGDTALDYFSFHNILSSGYPGSAIRYRIVSLTGIDIGGFDENHKHYPADGIPTPPSSFPSLRVQYKSGVLSQFISGKREDWLKNLNWNGYRGSITDAAGKDVEYEVALDDNTDKSTLNFNGNYEHMLLYKAFIQAGDNYKSVVLPRRNPEPEPVDAPVTVLAKVVAPTAVGEVQFKFNVEKKDTFIVVGGTVSPPLEFIIVPNDGTTYIIETPDVSNNDDLDDEYKEGDFAGSEEVVIPFEVAEFVGVGDEEFEYKTPPLSPNTPPGPGSGTSGPGTYKEGNGMSAKEWESKGTVMTGSKVPSNLSGPAKYNQKIKLNKTITNEYLPAIKGITGYTNGVKLLAIIMTQQEGFKAGTRSYRSNNPGNIGNTDKGGEVVFKTLADGIRFQLDRIKETAAGKRKEYPLGKQMNLKPYYSPEIAKNNGPRGPYKGMTAYLPGYKFTYTGMIEQYCKIYATGARTSNSYITMIVSWFRQNGYNWVTEETTLAQLVAAA